jgi:hypothetical protein
VGSDSEYTKREQYGLIIGSTAALLAVVLICLVVNFLAYGLP